MRSDDLVYKGDLLWPLIAFECHDNFESFMFYKEVISTKKYIFKNQSKQISGLLRPLRSKKVINLDKIYNLLWPQRSKKVINLDKILPKYSEVCESIFSL